MNGKSATRRMLLIACFTAICSLNGARAEIVEIGGDVEIADPPADITLGLWESGTDARIWFERMTTLDSPLMVDAVNTGTVFPGGIADNISTMTIESYMLRSDPIGDEVSTFTGFVIFDQPVLGVIFQGDALDITDAPLGSPGINIYNHNQARGLENPDTFEISADRLRVDFHYETGTWTDDVRIITAVPEPGTLALLGFAFLTVARRRRENKVKL